MRLSNVHGQCNIYRIKTVTAACLVHGLVHVQSSHCLKNFLYLLKLLRSPGIDSNESIPPAYLASRAGTTTLYSYSVPSPHRLF
jgi:hypothetical protein